MAIHFRPNGIYADTEEEKLTFYDKVCEGDPVIWGHITIWEWEQELANPGPHREVTEREHEKKD